MPTFAVTLRSTRQTSKTRVIPNVDAVSADSARTIAASPEWHAVEAKMVRGGTKKSTRPFPKKQMILLCRSMAGMIKAKIKTVDALNFYANGLPIEDLKLCIKSVASHIEAGEEPHRAFELTGRFDSTFVGLVRAGTLAGNLASALSAMAKRIQTELGFRSRIRKAVAMPAGILVFLLGAFIFSQIKLVPMVEKMLTDIRMKADGFTAVVFDISHATKVVWMPVVAGLVALVVVIVRSGKVRNQILGLAMSRWRLLRDLVMGVRQLNFLGTLHMLTSNNIPIDSALSTCAKVMKGTPFEKEIEEVRTRYAMGNPLAEAIRRYTSCDDTVAHMIEIGERSANMDEQLRLLVEMYEESTAERMETFTNVVTITGLTITVIVMGFVYLSAYMPIVLSGPKLMQGTSL